MTIRHAVAVFGVLAGAGLTAPAQDPPPPLSPITVDAIAAAGAAARGATVANVVPATFRGHLVVDNRFPPKERTPLKCEFDKPDPAQPIERDARDRTGKIHCLVCEYGLSPTIAIFVRADLKGMDAGSGLGKLVKDSNSLLAARRADKLGAFLMYLKLADEEKPIKAVKVKTPDGGEKEVTVDKEYPDDEKRDAHAKELCLFASAMVTDKSPLGAELVPFGLAPTKSESIRDFAIGDTTPVTVVIYNRMRMVERWELKPEDITDEKIREILNATEAMIGITKKK